MNMTTKLFHNLANGAPKMRRNQKNQNSLKALKAVPDEPYKKCMENWINRWHACTCLYCR